MKSGSGECECNLYGGADVLGGLVYRGCKGERSWERCCLGLPAALVVLAENQVARAVASEVSAAAIKIDDADQLGNTLPSVLLALSEPGRFERMSDAAAVISDGDGVFRALQATSAADGKD